MKEAVALSAKIKKFLEHDEYANVGDHGRKYVPSEALIAANGCVYEVGPDLCVVRSRYGYLAVGSGAQVAMGALAALPVDMPAQERALAALRAANRHSSYVRPPYHVLTLTKNVVESHTVDS
jgi:ATP-dependent protease HslVU (ClpYQ) peptidase subunit